MENVRNVLKDIKKGINCQDVNVRKMDFGKNCQILLSPKMHFSQRTVWRNGGSHPAESDVRT